MLDKTCSNINSYTNNCSTTRSKHFLNYSHIPRSCQQPGPDQKNQELNTSVYLLLVAFRAIITALAHHTITPCILCENRRIRKPFAISQYLAAVVNEGFIFAVTNLFQRDFAKLIFYKLWFRNKVNTGWYGIRDTIYANTGKIRGPS